MTDVRYNAELLAAHVALSARIDTESRKLDRMELAEIAGLPIDGHRYAEIEERWGALVAERDPLDDAVLAAPLGEVLAWLNKLGPEHGDDLFRRLVERVESLCAPTLALIAAE